MSWSKWAGATEPDLDEQMARLMAEDAVSVRKVGDEWVATCDHGDEVWEIHRGTRHNAYRSLRAHRRHEH